MPNKIKYPVVNGMKECGNCHKTKSITEFHRNRKRFVSWCKPCRKEYATGYRQRPEVKEHARDYVKEYRKDSDNRNRLNARTREWRKSPRAKKVRNETRKVWTAKEKQRAVEYKGGKCVCCGYAECLAALDFHHRNPKEKEGYGTGALVAHWSFKRNKKELDKCDLVCVRCHREIHAGFRTL
jgi:hypothetical protein